MESTDSMSTGDESEQDLVPSIWQRLPAEMLEMVLTKLPLSALKKFSGVSKSWNEFIHSEEFAHRCRSIEPTIFDFSFVTRKLKPFLAVPCVKTDSWVRYFLDFILDDESVDLFGTSEGLFCYRAYKGRDPRDKSPSNEEITLIVHNPFTRKWRRIICPYTFTSTEIDDMFGGLAVDQDTGSYKVVVAFVECYLPRETFIYDSKTRSWSVSAAMSPALTKSFDSSEWWPSRSICCDGEIYWLFKDEEHYFPSRHIGVLIKYSLELDTWSTSTQHAPCEMRCTCDLYLTSFQKRPMIVEIRHSSWSDVFPEEFSGWGSNLLRFSARDVARLVESAEGTGEGQFNTMELKRMLASGETSFTMARALAECETWFILYYDSESEKFLCLMLEGSSVTRLPASDIIGRYNVVDSLGTFTARLNSFV